MKLFLTSLLSCLLCSFAVKAELLSVSDWQSDRLYGFENKTLTFSED